MIEILAESRQTRPRSGLRSGSATQAREPSSATFLTIVDAERQTQTILLARKIGEFRIPERLEVPWSDSLCKRAQNEGRSFVDDVAAHWGSSEVIRDPSIATYLSMPVYAANGELFGTLCGASGSRVALGGGPQRTLSLCAYMIARQVDRERLIGRLQKENRSYASEALLDPLMGIPNRRALLRDMPRMLRLERFGYKIHVAMINLDGFKNINDTHGHDDRRSLPDRGRASAGQWRARK